MGAASSKGTLIKLLIKYLKKETKKAFMVITLKERFLAIFALHDEHVHSMGEFLGKFFTFTLQLFLSPQEAIYLLSTKLPNESEFK